MAGFSAFIPEGVKNGNGKRERMDQEEDQEFMPLSKRINNIHLSPERQINGHGPHHHSSVNGHGEVPSTSSASSMMNLNGLGPPSEHPGNHQQYSHHHHNQNAAGPVSNGFEEGASHSQSQLSSFAQHAQEFQNRHHNHHHHHHHHHANPNHHGSGYVNGLPNPQIDNLNSERILSTTNLGESAQATSPYHVPDEDSGDTRRFEYRPSLNESSNPYYYEPNRTLFNLYIERICRQNQSPHPDVFSRTNDSA